MRRIARRIARRELRRIARLLRRRRVELLRLREGRLVRDRVVVVVDELLLLDLRGAERALLVDRDAGGGELLRRARKLPTPDSLSFSFARVSPYLIPIIRKYTLVSVLFRVSFSCSTCFFGELRPFLVFFFVQISITQASQVF